MPRLPRPMGYTGLLLRTNFTPAFYMAQWMTQAHSFNGLMIQWAYDSMGL